MAITIAAGVVQRHRARPALKAARSTGSTSRHRRAPVRSPTTPTLPQGLHTTTATTASAALPLEYDLSRKIRPLLFRGLSGRILEAGVGTGRNFPFYPPGSEVVGIDISPAMLSRAERRRHSAATKVELRQMDVTRLSFPDRSFDAAVAAFLFCTLPDELQVARMRELGRVAKHGGFIRCLAYPR